MNPHLEDKIVDQLMKAKHVLLLPSAPSDGDSIGSALSLYSVLNKLGKEATVIVAEEIPHDLQFLPLIEVTQSHYAHTGNLIITVHADAKDVVHRIEPGKVNIVVTPQEGMTLRPQDVHIASEQGPYDLIVTVDTGGVEQFRGFYEENTDLFKRLTVINIDHHASNNHFGDINYVETKASATTEMLAPIIEKLEQSSGKTLMDADIATLLLAGIITDTGSFQHSNTTPEAFAASAKLLDHGARQQEIIKHVYKTKSLSTLKLWGQVLSKIQFAKAYGFVWSTISQFDLKETGAEMQESGAIIDDLLNNAPGAEVVALMKEKQDGLLSCSLRSTTDAVDVSEIAKHFGGGGHKRAAGCRVQAGNFDAGVQQVVDYILSVQAKRLNKPMPNTQVHDAVMVSNT